MLFVEALKGKHTPFAVTVINCAITPTVTTMHIVNWTLMIYMYKRDSLEDKVADPHLQIDELVVY